MIHRSVVDDPGFEGIYDNEAMFGAWVKLLIGADAAWPASAEIPAWCPAEVISKLAAVNILVKYPRGRYRLPDFDIEREERAWAGKAGGIARAETADRDPASGRYQRTPPAVAGTSDAQPPRGEQRREEESRDKRADSVAAKLAPSRRSRSRAQRERDELLDEDRAAQRAVGRDESAPGILSGDQAWREAMGRGDWPAANARAAEIAVAQAIDNKKIPAAEPDGAHVECSDPHAHSTAWRRDGAGWTCDACHPVGAQAIPS